MSWSTAAPPCSINCFDHNVLAATRVGVNTGECVVGNFGGAARFDYTAHGDSINTAARLEGANKHLGTRVCVSQATRALCTGIAFRPIGSLLLKGKTEAIDVFEPVHAAESGDERHQAYREAFALMAQGDIRAGSRFADLAATWPDDGLIAFHAERLARGLGGERVVLSRK